MNSLLRYMPVIVLTASLVRCVGCERGPIHPEAIKHHDTGIQYLNQGQCVQAEERCRLALEYGNDFAHPYNCLGLISLICKNDINQAADYFKDALSINEDFAEAHNNLGSSFFRRTPPDYEGACEEFKAAIEIDPGYLDARENYGMCLMRQGTILGDKGDIEERTELYKEARSHLIRLLELNPNSFNSRHHLGFMDLVEERYDEAEDNFKRCLEIDPENPVCCYNLGNTHLRTAKCKDAIQEFICALRSGENTSISVGARQNLGAAYEECAKADGAIRQFLNRIKLDPANPTHHYDLGNIYASKGLADQAVREWQYTVKLAPKYCPPYYDLALYANQLLDTQKTVSRCRDMVACAAEVNRTAPIPKWEDKVDRCKSLIRELDVE